MKRLPILTAAFSLCVATPALATPVFFGIDKGSSMLGRVDLATGEWTSVGQVWDLSGGQQSVINNLEAMTFDWDTGRLLVVRSQGNNPSQLFEVDPLTGGAALLGAVGYSGIRGLAYDAENDRLVGVRMQGSSTQLLSIDAFSGAATVLGTMTGLGTVTDLALNPLTGELFGSVPGRRALVQLDPANPSQYTLLDRHGEREVDALAFDHSGDLYGINRRDDVLRFDVATGLDTDTGFNVPYNNVDAMVFVQDSFVSVPAPAIWMPLLLSGVVILRAEQRWM